MLPPSNHLLCLDHSEEAGFSLGEVYKGHFQSPLGVTQPIAAPSLCEDREGWPCTTSLVASVWTRQVQVQLSWKDCQCQAAQLEKPDTSRKRCEWEGTLAQDVQREGRESDMRPNFTGNSQQNTSSVWGEGRGSGTGLGRGMDGGAGRQHARCHRGQAQLKRDPEVTLAFLPRQL